MASSARSQRAQLVPHITLLWSAPKKRWDIVGTVRGSVITVPVHTSAPVDEAVMKDLVRAVATLMEMLLPFGSE